jgi:phosphocarrier protein
MKNYVHTVKDPRGIHARPAGLIAKLAKEYADTSIIFSYNGTEAKAASLMKLMSLGVKQGAEITITAEGASEYAAIIAMSQFVNNNL